MNPESFCTEFQPPKQQGQHSGRRLSTSWDNEAKITGGLVVPIVNQRRNSNTLAQLLEGHHRQLSLSQDLSCDVDNLPRSRPESRRTSIISRRHSVGSRRPSIAEMLVDDGESKTTEDCVMVTQTLGTSTTLFFQKNPLADNLDLRPSAAERGLYNFDDSIKEKPQIAQLKYIGTPRPSIQLHLLPKPSTLSHTIPSIDESEDGERTPTIYQDTTIRPSLNERGLPVMKFTPVLPNGQLPTVPRGRTLHKQPRADPRFDFELDRIIASRRKIVDEEETKRERENQIRPRIVQQVNRTPHRAHFFDGKSPNQLQGGIMEELRNQMEGGEVDRIVKEKKTTTVTETREIVYFTHRLPSSIAISTRLSPTGVPVQNPNRRSITVEGSLPELLDRPYVRDGKQGSPSDSKVPTKTVTIRVPPDHQQNLRGPIQRSATPSPHNVRLLTAAEKAALRHNASKYEMKPTTDQQHPLDDAADSCRQS